MQAVCVMIPTMRRPESLARALRSVFAQDGLADRPVSIVVVDNDPAATARSTVETLKADSPFPVVYRHEPRPGVATARNAGLSETDAPLIAFLDDDEAASKGWLTALLRAQEETKADAVFGPIAGRIPDERSWAAVYLQRFFGRRGPLSTGLIDHGYGCGNSLMVRHSALPGTAPFDASADQTGGEDDALFAALKARGGRFGWAHDAWVEEFAPPHRATMSYALSRAFAYGQGPSQTAAKARDWSGVFRWMLIGTAQAVVWGLGAMALTIAAHPRRADLMDKAARGLGKVLWTKSFEPKLYGVRELQRLDAVNPSAA
ncbi:MAG: glycosyltransferase family 2 protein [Brevundimonas sp.]|jgi:glycosyltransferase involved in cell wall biosynthesis|nr:glycosyltransferase family 2 protein [Brevundimonas sp.]